MIRRQMTLSGRYFNALFVTPFEPGALSTCPLHSKRWRHFGHMQCSCGYTHCVACGETHLSGKCCTAQQQLKCCSYEGNHTAIYRGCVNCNEALAKRSPVLSSRGCTNPSCPTKVESSGGIRRAGEPRTRMEPRCPWGGGGC